MEQFKELKWSWYKYKEERNLPPKDYNFETINNHDVLSRTLNEIHKCVLPRETEYRLMKPQEEDQSADELNDEEIVKVKDPRMNPTRIIENSDEMTRCYGYSSELSMQQQRVIMNSIQLNIKHNPVLYNQKSPRKHRQQLQLPQDLEAKRKVECLHFNKCAETFYYRHISELNSILGSDVRSFLIDRWRSQEFQQEFGYNFKAITMLLRDQNCEGEVTIELKSTESETFDQKAYLITDEAFLPLNKFSSESVKDYSDLKKHKVELTLETQFDIALSLDVLVKLLADTEMFSVTFDNEMNSNEGKMILSFNDALPLKPVRITDAVKDFVTIAVKMGHEWNCLDNFMKTNVEDLSKAEDIVQEITNVPKSYQVESTRNLMTQNYKKFKNFNRENKILNVWLVSKEQQSFRVLVSQTDNYFIQSEDNSIVKANISIKLEYQLKFGAEKMEKSELLSEWCEHRFNTNSVTLRYRVDAKTLTVLSITKVSLEEIERELLENYQTNPNATLCSLFNVLSCAQRLPEGKFKIKAAVEDSVKKLVIYKACESIEEVLSEPWTISTEFARSWIPIDDSTPTYVHLKHQLSPCCFVPSNKRKLTSYIQKPQQKKTTTAKVNQSPSKVCFVPSNKRKLTSYIQKPQQKKTTTAKVNQSPSKVNKAKNLNKKNQTNKKKKKKMNKK